VPLVKGDHRVGLGPPADAQVTGNDAGLVDADLRKRWGCARRKTHQSQSNRFHAALSQFSGELVAPPRL
jgi:hypothetical protein